jgi:hypothetical protein
METFDAVVLADEPITGVAERLAALEADGEEAAALLRWGLERDGIALPVERGVPASLERIVERVRGRRLIEDLGETPSSFELLALHVPPGGRAKLAVRRSAESNQRMSVNALGFGFGGGRKLTIALSEGIAERTSCMRVMQHVVLHVRRFVVGEESASDEQVTTDLVRYGAREPRAWPDCPYCGPGKEPDPFDFDIDEANALDLRGFDAELTREQSYTLERERKADVGVTVTVPGAGPIAAGFHLEQVTSIDCTVSYAFPPGKCFVPYRSREGTPALPYWNVV